MAVFPRVPWSTSFLAVCGTQCGYWDPTTLPGKNQRNIADPQNSTLRGQDGSYTVFPEGA